MAVAPRGIIPPVVVPFTADDRIDEKAFRREVAYLVKTGIHGISSGGSTGEGALLSDQELRRCLELVSEEKPSGMPLLAGIIRNSTRDVVKAGLDAKSIGVDALLVTPVFYYGATAEGNFNFFKEIARQTRLPIIIYNVVPTNLISPETFLKLLEIDELIGIKQVDPVALAEFDSLRPAARAFTIYAACDQLLYSSYVAGAAGAISALSTVAPALCVRQWELFERGDQKGAMEIQHKLVPIVRTYLQKPFPGKIKELLNLQGRQVGTGRPPLEMPTVQQKDEMRKALANAGLIQSAKPCLGQADCISFNE